MRLPRQPSGKEFACQAGEVGLIPGSGRFPREGISTHSSILAWEILWTEEPVGLQSMGSQKHRTQLSDSLATTRQPGHLSVSLTHHTIHTNAQTHSLPHPFLFLCLDDFSPFLNPTNFYSLPDCNFHGQFSGKCSLSPYPSPLPNCTQNSS